MLKVESTDGSSSPQSAAPRRICMVTHSFYEADNRVIRYAEALAERGDRVEVIALRRSPQMLRSEVINGVVVHRIQDRFEKGEGSAWSYLWPLVRFLVVSMRWLSANGRDKPFDLVHVHNIPDFLVFSAWPAKRRGGRVILDIHDIVPEFFGSKFRVGPESLLVRGLRLIERVSARFADHVILSNHLWLEKYTARSASPDKCSVFINHVDRGIFKTQPASSKSQAPLILFPGGLHWHQGLDIAIRAFAILIRELPDARFHIYGDGSSKRELMALVDQLRLNDSVKFFAPLSLREIAKVMADASLGVVPKRADSFGNEAYSTKIMEFMAVGVPVVISETQVDRYYFDDSVVRFFPSGNEEALAHAMYDLLSDGAGRETQVRNATAYVERNSWERRKSEYLRLVDDMMTHAVASVSPLKAVGS